MPKSKNFLIALLFIFLCPGKAVAHHTSQVSRLGAPTIAVRSSAKKNHTPPRLSIGLALSFSHFGRARLETKPYIKNAIGKAWVETNTLDVTLALPRRFFTSLSLPTGLIRLLPPNESSRTTKGLGDLTLALGRQIPGTSSLPWLSAIFRGALTVPTGQYREESAFLLTEIAGGANGELGLRTYDSRASLGADTFSVNGSISIAAQIHPRIFLQNMTAFRLPIGRTRDDIRWGSDLESTISLGGSLTKAVTLLGGAEFRKHLPDQTRMLEGTMTHASTGGREDLGLEFGVSIGITKAISCGGRARFPIWQQTSGVQLVYSFGLETNCRIDIR